MQSNDTTKIKNWLCTYIKTRVTQFTISKQIIQAMYVGPKETNVQLTTYVATLNQLATWLQLYSTMQAHFHSGADGQLAVLRKSQVYVFNLEKSLSCVIAVCVLMDSLYKNSW